MVFLSPALQNHKTTKLLGLKRISGDQLVQTLAKAGHKECIQVGFECLKRKKVHNFSGQPVLVLCQPQHKEILTHFKVKLLAF